MIDGINFNVQQSYTPISNTKTSQNETGGNTVSNQSQAEEDEMVSTDFEADTAQLQEDWNYFNELKTTIENKKQDAEKDISTINAKDKSEETNDELYAAIKEVLSIQAGEKVEETDENAIQYNKNTDLLLEVQAEARAAQSNA